MPRDTKTLLLLVALMERRQKDQAALKMQLELLHARVDILQSVLSGALQEGFHESGSELQAHLDRLPTGNVIEEIHKKEDHEIDQFEALLAQLKRRLEETDLLEGESPQD